MKDEIKRLRDVSTQLLKRYGVEFSSCGASHDKDIYLKYHDSLREDVPEVYDQTIRVLNILNRLGFPMELVGTYLYKMVIDRIIKRLKKGEDIHLIDELKSMYSQFYFDIARNDLDIGTKTFYRFIRESLDKTDLNQELLEDILEGNEFVDFQELSYYIGKYIFLEKDIDVPSNGHKIYLLK